MRIADLGELMEGYKREGIDPEPYYWCVPLHSRTHELASAN